MNALTSLDSALLPAPTAPSATTFPAGRVHSLVAAHLEQVTRFDANDLREIEAEQIFAVPLTLTQDQEVAFAITIQSGPAQLASGIKRVATETELRREMQIRLQTSINEAPLALKHWSEQETGSYRRLLPARAAFLRAPGAVGYEHRCTSCKGACEVTCETCSGVGTNLCPGCGGRGRIHCYSCGGSKKVTCSSCHGRGQWTEQVPMQRWSSSANSYVTEYRTEQRYCGPCSAAGRLNCYSCEYDGKNPCSGCFGPGRINCGPCGATGQVPCGPCRASGVQHVWGTVEATVECREGLSISHEDEALRKLVHTRVRLADLPELGELLDVQNSVTSDTLRSEHHLRLDVQRARISARDETFVIYGLGPGLKVYSFENIAGRLLLEDLEALESVEAVSSRWRRQSGSELLQTMAAFLQSEINMLIAERVSDLKSTPQQAAAQVQEHFCSLVDSTYVERATTALRGALARLYGAELMEPAVYLCALTALAAGALFGLGWPSHSPWTVGSCALAGALLGWGALEWLTRRRIARHFSSEFAARVLSQLAANGSRRRWRLGVGAASIAAAALGVVGVQQLPFVHSQQNAQSDIARSSALLARWHQQASADFRQRQYPAREVLDRMVKQGDTRAQLILAWQLLLGAGGAAKDVAVAGELLERARGKAAGDPLWQAARAVHILNQEAMPDAIRTANADLGKAADRGLVEARYWQARIYLEERSPAFDAPRGLRALTLAADLGHARAALMLGERLAAGRGTQRDVNAARRYLQRAADDGLADARSALAMLR